MPLSHDAARDEVVQEGAPVSHGRAYDDRIVLQSAAVGAHACTPIGDSRLHSTRTVTAKLPSRTFNTGHQQCLPHACFYKSDEFENRFNYFNRIPAHILSSVHGEGCPDSTCQTK